MDANICALWPIIAADFDLFHRLCVVARREERVPGAALSVIEAVGTQPGHDHRE